MKKLFAIFAHPDDEGAIAGTLTHYAAQEIEVILICATKGEAGEISDSDLDTSENLGVVRTAELQDACEIIGISQLHFLGYQDSGMAGAASNEDPLALVQAAPEAVIRKIVALIRQLQPDVVITFHMLETKKAAMWAHRTQFGKGNWFRKMPKEITRQVWGDEYFIQAYPPLLQ